MYTDGIEYRKERDEELYLSYKRGQSVLSLARKYNISATRVHEIIAKKKRSILFEKESNPEITKLYKTIHSLPLVPHAQTRIYNSLRRKNINTLGDLQKCSPDELKKIRGMGKTSVETLIKAGLIREVH